MQIDPLKLIHAKFTLTNRIALARWFCKQYDENCMAQLLKLLDDSALRMLYRKITGADYPNYMSQDPVSIVITTKRKATRFLKENDG